MIRSGVKTSSLSQSKKARLKIQKAAKEYWRKRKEKEALDAGTRSAKTCPSSHVGDPQ